MSIYKARWWQLCLAGLIAGVVLAAGRTLARENELIGGEEFISQDFFDQMLLLRGPDGEPFIRSITVYSRGNIDLLIFDAYDELARTYTTRRLAARRPYLPAGGQIPVPSIYDYLLTLTRTIPDLRVRYAWWSEPRPMFLICAGGGALMGSLLPLVRWFLVGRRPKPSTAMSFNAQSTDELTDAKNPQAADTDRTQLKEVESTITQALGAAVREASRETNTSAYVALMPSAIRPLDNDVIVAQDCPPPDEKEYVGEYYPVVKKGRHGFTLVELLVTIGIIVLLIAILLPMVFVAREHANRTQCASNLRQIGAALEVYNQTYHSLPLVATPVGLNDAMNEVRVVGIMTCPDDLVGALSYAMNAAYIGLPKSQGGPSEALAFETGAGHRGLCNTLFFDGRVDNQVRGTP